MGGAESKENIACAEEKQELNLEIDYIFSRAVHETDSNLQYQLYKECARLNARLDSLTDLVVLPEHYIRYRTEKVTKPYDPVMGKSAKLTERRNGGASIK